MKRIMWLGSAALVALVGAGLGIAAKRDQGTTAVAFALSGTSGDARTHTCTGVDGTYVRTRARYTGTATGLYDGASVRIRLESTVNTTKGLGVASGHVRIRSDRLEAKANLVGTIEGSTLTGVLRGRDVRGADRGRLIANFSATLGTGTIALTAGGGAADNDAVLFGGRGCGRVLLSGALGTVSAISATSITVTTSGGSVTCSLTAEQAARLAGRIVVGHRVSIRCDADAKLVRIDRRR